MKKYPVALYFLLFCCAFVAFSITAFAEEGVFAHPLVNKQGPLLPAGTKGPYNTTPPIAKNCTQDVPDFEAFFTKYAENTAMQYLCASFPIKYSTFSNSPNAKTEYKEIFFPVKENPETSQTMKILPTEKERETSGLQLEILPHETEKDAMVVTIFQESTGRSIAYVFVWNKFWYLTEISELSF